MAPKTALKLSPYEILEGRPFLTSDILFDSEVQDQIKYIINLGQIQKALVKYGNKVLLAPDPEAREQPISPGNLVLLKTWK